MLHPVQAAVGTKYLVVDDHPRTRHALIEALSRPGDTFHEAASGEEALTLYEATLPDWVIMDVRMPGLDGLATTTRIVARHPEARVLLVSQFDDEELTRQARESGARGFLSKDAIADLRSLLEQL